MFKRRQSVKINIHHSQNTIPVNLALAQEIDFIDFIWSYATSTTLFEIKARVQLWCNFNTIPQLYPTIGSSYGDNCKLDPAMVTTVDWIQWLGTTMLLYHSFALKANIVIIWYLQLIIHNLKIKLIVHGHYPSSIIVLSLAWIPHL